MLIDDEVNPGSEAVDRDDRRTCGESKEDVSGSGQMPHHSGQPQTEPSVKCSTDSIVTSQKLCGAGCACARRFLVHQPRFKDEEGDGSELEIMKEPLLVEPLVLSHCAEKVQMPDGSQMSHVDTAYRLR